jgi:hypothetical protein
MICPVFRVPVTHRMAVASVTSRNDADAQHSSPSAGGAVNSTLRLDAAATGDVDG